VTIVSRIVNPIGRGVPTGPLPPGGAYATPGYEGAAPTGGGGGAELGGSDGGGGGGTLPLGSDGGGGGALGTSVMPAPLIDAIEAAGA
jgi:hypothetical protein